MSEEEGESRKGGRQDAGTLESGRKSNKENGDDRIGRKGEKGKREQEGRD